MISLAEAKDASSTRLFQLPVAKAIAAQIVQAVAFLHARGAVHAGTYLCFGLSISTRLLKSKLYSSIQRFLIKWLYYGSP